GLPAAPRRGRRRGDPALHRPSRRAAVPTRRATVRGPGRPPRGRGPDRDLLERPHALAPERRDHRCPPRPRADRRPGVARDGHGPLGRSHRHRDPRARAGRVRRLDGPGGRVPVSPGRERARPAGPGGAGLRRDRGRASRAGDRDRGARRAPSRDPPRGGRAPARPGAAQEAPKTGGVLRVATIGEPPTLDLHTTKAVIVQQITWHVFEGLYTYDKNYNPMPLLVDGHTVTDKGRAYTFRLRR